MEDTAETLVVGIDCATDPGKIGLARGTFREEVVTVTQALAGISQQQVCDCIHGWMLGHERVLLALDAPLGWPVQLGTTLAGHAAGQPIGIEPNKLFRRETDRFIKQRIGKQPLDVGADRIARTAHAALALIERVRTASQRPIELGWDPAYTSGVVAIEVYPAATLRVHGLHATGYKGRDDTRLRRSILGGVAERLVVTAARQAMLDNADVLDAVICTLAGQDFLCGRTMAPKDLELAKKEGWIWVAGPGA